MENPIVVTYSLVSLMLPSITIHIIYVISLLGWIHVHMYVQNIDLNIIFCDSKMFK